MAATIKFNELYKKAILINVRGTREVIKLAKNCKNIQHFCHLSTIMSHLGLEKLDEITYEPPMDPNLAIEIAEFFSEEATEKFFKNFEYKGKLCSYSFTKSLAEGLISESQLPVSICRFGLVTGTEKNPFTGWTTVLTGLSGLIKASVYGLMRTFILGPNELIPFVPGDHVINNIMLATWDHMKKSSLEVVNIHHYQIKVGELFGFSRPFFIEKYELNFIER